MRVFPVIHQKDWKTSLANLKIIFENGKRQADGVFFISMDGNDSSAFAEACEAKKLYKHKLIGINHLQETAFTSLKLASNWGLDMCWSDAQLIMNNNIDDEALAISKVLEPLADRDFKFFTSVAFKYQEPDNTPHFSARYAMELGLIPTTSGSATGVAADIDKVKKIRSMLKNGPLALASGLTPDNVKQYLPYVSHALVSTGISKNFYEFDQQLFDKFMENSDSING